MTNQQTREVVGFAEWLGYVSCCIGTDFAELINSEEGRRFMETPYNLGYSVQRAVAQLFNMSPEELDNAIHKKEEPKDDLTGMFFQVYNDMVNQIGAFNPTKNKSIGSVVGTVPINGGSYQIQVLLTANPTRFLSEEDTTCFSEVILKSEKQEWTPDFKKQHFSRFNPKNQN